MRSKPKIITFEGETYYPIREAAKILGWSIDYLYDAIKQKKVRVSSMNVKRISATEIKRILDGAKPNRIELESAAARDRRLAAVDAELDAKGC